MVPSGKPPFVWGTTGDLFRPAYGGPPPMGLTGPSSLENVHRTFSRALGPPKGKAGDGRVMDSEIDHILHGPSGRDRCGRFCTALLVTPKASPPQWGGGPKGRWGTSCHGALPAQTIEQGSATAMWARAAVLVWKACCRAREAPYPPLRGYFPTAVGKRGDRRPTKHALIAQ